MRQNPVLLPCSTKPVFSVIIPVLNGGKLFEQCLQAIAASSYRDFECLVVDDGSNDGSGAVAAKYGATVLSSGGRAFGPARARNVAAQVAQGEWLFFVDADVLVHPDTLAKAAGLIADSSCEAFFGSYDNQPGNQSFLSQYRNLFHHYTHQQARTQASTFWSGCGGVKREVFLELGGFSQNYPRPSIEDIEFGYRLNRAGYTIRLEKELLATHLKPWRFKSMLRTDIRDRAIPWTRLILSSGKLPNDLNVTLGSRFSIVAVALLGLTLLTSLWWVWASLVSIAVAVFLFVINWQVYRFFARQKDWWFAVRVVPFHWLYYFYSGLSFGLGLSLFLVLDYPRLRRTPKNQRGASEIAQTPQIQQEALANE